MMLLLRLLSMDLEIVRLTSHHSVIKKHCFWPRKSLHNQRLSPCSWNSLVNNASHHHEATNLMEQCNRLLKMPLCFQLCCNSLKGWGKVPCSEYAFNLWCFSPITRTPGYRYQGMETGMLSLTIIPSHPQPFICSSSHDLILYWVRSLGSDGEVPWPKDSTTMSLIWKPRLSSDCFRFLTPNVNRLKHSHRVRRGDLSELPGRNWTCNPQWSWGLVLCPVINVKEKLQQYNLTRMVWVRRPAKVISEDLGNAELIIEEGTYKY